MLIQINGDPRELPADCSAGQLISDLKLTSKRIAMELGCNGVLMNTAVAGAKDPVRAASAMRKAIEAGREAFPAGRIPRKRFASASSPIDGAFF